MTKKFIWSIAVSACLISGIDADRTPCHSLTIEDPMLGTLVPCEHPQAQGMLCVRDMPYIVVWPEKTESDAMARCGLTIQDEEDSRKRRSVFKDQSQIRKRRNLLNGDRKRKKRQGTFSLDLSSHIEMGYNYVRMLRELVRLEYGNHGKIVEDPAAELFLKTKLQLEQNFQQGIYRALVGPASEFDPESKNRAKDTILKLLRDKKKKENWDWLDTDRIGRELEMCFYSDYSTVTAQDVLFKTPEESVLLEMGTNKSRSTFGYWYFKVVCMRDEDRIFLTTVVYTDQMRLADIEKTVQFWRNNPETVTKLVKGTRQRLKESIQGEVVTDRTEERGVTCHSYKTGWWFSKRRKTVCNPYTNVREIPRSIRLTKQQVLQDETTKKFTYEINKWIKDTKKMMERRTLTLQEREALKDWLHNIVLSEIMEHFSQFLRDETQTIGIDGF